MFHFNGLDAKGEPILVPYTPAETAALAAEVNG